MSETNFLNQITFEPLSRDNWDKFVKLFGEKGACENCWCMYYRLRRADFIKGKDGGGNKNAMMTLVEKGSPAGILGFFNGDAIAWCAFAPREDFIKLENSRVHKRIDDIPVWSVPCLFVARGYRRQGVASQLLMGVIKFAKEKGIKVIEAYPIIPTTEKVPDPFAWNGFYKTFEKLGFKIVDQKSANRPMVRYTLP